MLICVQRSCCSYDQCWQCTRFTMNYKMTVWVARMIDVRAMYKQTIAHRFRTQRQGGFTHPLVYPTDAKFIGFKRRGHSGPSFNRFREAIHVCQLKSTQCSIAKGLFSSLVEHSQMVFQQGEVGHVVERLNLLRRYRMGGWWGGWVGWVGRGGGRAAVAGFFT